MNSNSPNYCGYRDETLQRNLKLNLKSNTCRLNEQIIRLILELFERYENLFLIIFNSKFEFIDTTVGSILDMYYLCNIQKPIIHACF